MIRTARLNLIKLTPELVTICAVLIIFVLCLQFISPSWSGTYRVGDSSRDEAFRESFAFSSGEVLVNVSGTVSVSSIYPTSFRIVPDDCLVELSINDRPVSTGLPMCDFTKGRVFQLRDYLHPGQNKFRAVVRNRGGPGGLSVRYVMWDPVPLSLISLATLGILACLVSGAYKLGIASDPLTVVWFFGTIVRFIYFLATPIGARAYDAQGHHDYIIYVVERFAIPPTQGGWEFYQPPLYYFFTAALLMPFTYMGWGDVFLLNVAQGISFLLSAAALAAGIWVGKILWRSPNDSFLRTGFALSLAVLPGLVMFSSRITNDAMMPLLGFLFVGLLLRWYETGLERLWYASVVVLGLALITKSSAMAYVPIAFLSLALAGSDESGLKGRARQAAKAGLILFVMVGWYWAYRIAGEGSTGIVATNSLNRKLSITVSPLTFLSIDPFSVIRHPYNHPWVDDFGRDRMWSFLPKSAFTGEWNFGERVNRTMRVVHGLNYVLLFPLAVISMARDIFRGRHPSLLLTLVCVLGATIVMVIRQPFGILHEFRHVPIISIPVSYYVLSGVGLLPAVLRRMVLGMLVLFWSLCLYVLYGIAFSS